MHHPSSPGGLALRPGKGCCPVYTLPQDLTRGVLWCILGDMSLSKLFMFYLLKHIEVLKQRLKVMSLRSVKTIEIIIVLLALFFIIEGILLLVGTSKDFIILSCCYIIGGMLYLDLKKEIFIKYIILGLCIIISCILAIFGFILFRGLWIWLIGLSILNIIAFIALIKLCLKRESVLSSPSGTPSPARKTRGRTSPSPEPTSGQGTTASPSNAGSSPTR